MPSRAPHPCAAPRCPNTITSGGRCDVHRRREPDTRTDTRTMAQKGYGADWYRLRGWVLINEPLCRPCKAMTPPRITRAVQVDHHLARNKGGTDELSNLVPMCLPCHSRKTVREDGGFGRPTLAERLAQ